MEIDEYNIRGTILNLFNGLLEDGEPLHTSAGWHVQDIEDDEDAGVLRVTAADRTGRTRGYTIQVTSDNAHPITPTPATSPDTSDPGGTFDAADYLDMNRIADLVYAAGVTAWVDGTSSIATLYFGPKVPGSDEYTRATLVMGPGDYVEGPWQKPMLIRAEASLGRDDLGMTGSLWAPTAESTEDDAAKAVIAAYQRVTAERVAVHRAEMAKLVKVVADGLQDVLTYWNKHELPDDFSTAETGYPFDCDLAEQVGALYGWQSHLAGESEPVIGDVGKCSNCGRQTRSYSRGCSECGHGKPVDQPTTQQQELVQDMIRRLAKVRAGRTDHYNLGAFEMVQHVATIVYDEEWSDAKTRVTEALKAIPEELY